MAKAHKVFKYIWRANAVLILLAAAALVAVAVALVWSEVAGSAARSRALDAAPPLRADHSGARLYLGPVELVEGAGVLRGELLAQRSGGGLSSGSYSETRNMLFVDDESQAARWLLPDDDHVITQHRDIATPAARDAPARVVATVAVVKPAQGELDAAEGTLLLLDPSGRRLQTIADGVRELHTAHLAANGRITLLFERRRKFMVALFDAATLAKTREYEVGVPVLK